MPTVAPGRRRRRLALAALVALGALLPLLVLVATGVLSRPADDVVYTDPVEEHRTVKYFRSDPDLGYAAVPGARARARRTIGGRVAYDVVYTIDEQGRRETPGSADGPAYLFFGDSMTFGEGVGDEATLPAAFARTLQTPAGVHNFAFHGYGPHQMVRALEVGRADAFAGRVARVFHQSHPWHAARAPGRSPWEIGGPRYVADDAGGEAGAAGPRPAATAGPGVRYAGPFHSPLVARALRVVNRVPPLRALRERMLLEPPLTEAERELHAGLLIRAAMLARERLGAPFTVLHWDDDTPEDDRFLARVQSAGVDVIRVSDVIPRARWGELSIPGDGHPTGEAYALLAAELARRYGPGREPS